MFRSLHTQNTAPARYLTTFFAFITFLSTSLLPVPSVLAQNIALPPVGQMIPLSTAYTPNQLLGIQVNPDNPMRMSFFVHRKDYFSGQTAFEEETSKLIKYFLTALTLPEDHLWVNLSPYEKDRILENDLGHTEMGLDLLAQDYLLKQIMSSLMYPEEGAGKTFWSSVHQQLQEQLGTTDIPLDTFNKVWIVPDEAIVYEEGQTAWVAHTHLKVMLEKDYLALANQKANAVSRAPSMDKAESPAEKISADTVRSVLLPVLEEEVNNGEHFAKLRQIVSSMVLATWYKRRLKASFLGQNYVDKGKILGIQTDGTDTKEQIYNQYLESFKIGVFDYIKEELDPQTQEIIPRKYFSGGYAYDENNVTNVTDLASLSSGTREQIRYDLAMLMQSTEVVDVRFDGINTQGQTIDLSEETLTDAAMNTEERQKALQAMKKRMKQKAANIDFDDETIKDMVLKIELAKDNTEYSTKTLQNLETYLLNNYTEVARLEKAITFFDQRTPEIWGSFVETLKQQREDLLETLKNTPQPKTLWNLAEVKEKLQEKQSELEDINRQISEKGGTQKYGKITVLDETKTPNLPMTKMLKTARKEFNLSSTVHLPLRQVLEYTTKEGERHFLFVGGNSQFTIVLEFDEKGDHIIQSKLADQLQSLVKKNINEPITSFKTSTGDVFFLVTGAKNKVTLVKENGADLTGAEEERYKDLLDFLNNTPPKSNAFLSKAKNFFTSPPSSDYPPKMSKYTDTEQNDHLLVSDSRGRLVLNFDVNTGEYAKQNIIHRLFETWLKLKGREDKRIKLMHSFKNTENENIFLTIFQDSNPVKDNLLLVNEYGNSRADTPLGRALEEIITRVDVQSIQSHKEIDGTTTLMILGKDRQTQASVLTAISEDGTPVDDINEAAFAQDIPPNHEMLTVFRYTEEDAPAARYISSEMKMEEDEPILLGFTQFSDLNRIYQSEEVTALHPLAELASDLFINSSLRERNPNINALGYNVHRELLEYTPTGQILKNTPLTQAVQKANDGNPSWIYSHKTSKGDVYHFSHDKKGKSFVTQKVAAVEEEKTPENIDQLLAQKENLENQIETLKQIAAKHQKKINTETQRPQTISKTKASRVELLSKEEVKKVNSASFTAPENQEILTLSPDRTKALTYEVTNDHRHILYIMDTQTNEVLHTLEQRGHKAKITSAAFSPDNTKIVTASYDKTIKIWDAVNGGTPLHTLEGHEDWVLSVAFSPDSTRVVSTSEDMTIKIWDAVKGGSSLHTLRGHMNWPLSAQFSPDGKRIVSASKDKTIKIWDAINGGDALLTLEGHTDHVTFAAFSPDGKQIVSASKDTTAKIWDALNGGEALHTLEGHTDRLTSTQFSPNNKQIISTSEKSVKVWDAINGGDALLTLKEDQEQTRPATFSSDGTQIYSIEGRDSKVFQIGRKITSPGNITYGEITSAEAAHPITQVTEYISQQDWEGKKALSFMSLEGNRQFLILDTNGQQHMLNKDPSSDVTSSSLLNLMNRIDEDFEMFAIENIERYTENGKNYFIVNGESLIEIYSENGTPVNEDHPLRKALMDKSGGFSFQLTRIEIDGVEKLLYLNDRNQTAIFETDGTPVTSHPLLEEMKQALDGTEEAFISFTKIDGREVIFVKTKKTDLTEPDLFSFTSDGRKYLDIDDINYLEGPRSKLAYINFYETETENVYFHANGEKLFLNTYEDEAPAFRQPVTRAASNSKTFGPWEAVEEGLPLADTIKVLKANIRDNAISKIVQIPADNGEIHYLVVGPDNRNFSEFSENGVFLQNSSLAKNINNTVEGAITSLTFSRDALDPPLIRITNDQGKIYEFSLTTLEESESDLMSVVNKALLKIQIGNPNNKEPFVKGFHPYPSSSETQRYLLWGETFQRSNKPFALLFEADGTPVQDFQLSDEIKNIFHSSIPSQIIPFTKSSGETRFLVVEEGSENMFAEFFEDGSYFQKSPFVMSLINFLKENKTTLSHILITDVTEERTQFFFQARNGAKIELRDDGTPVTDSLLVEKSKQGTDGDSFDINDILRLETPQGEKNIIAVGAKGNIIGLKKSQGTPKEAPKLEEAQQSRQTELDNITQEILDLQDRLEILQEEGETLQSNTLTFTPELTSSSKNISGPPFAYTAEKEEVQTSPFIVHYQKKGEEGERILEVGRYGLTKKTLKKDGIDTPVEDSPFVKNIKLEFFNAEILLVRRYLTEEGEQHFIIGGERDRTGILVALDEEGNFVRDNPLVLENQKSGNPKIANLFPYVDPATNKTKTLAFWKSPEKDISDPVEGVFIFDEKSINMEDSQSLGRIIASQLKGYGVVDIFSYLNKEDNTTRLVIISTRAEKFHVFEFDTLGGAYEDSQLVVSLENILKDTKPSDVKEFQYLDTDEKKEFNIIKKPTPIKGTDSFPLFFETITFEQNILPEEKDPAMLKSNQEQVGGIDINPNNMDLQIESDQELFFNPESLPSNTLDIQGLVPVILQITPMTVLPNFVQGAGPPNTEKAEESTISEKFTLSRRHP